MVQSLPKRADVNINETWDLAHIFATEEAYTQALHDIEQQVEQFADTWLDKFSTAEQVVAMLRDYEKLQQAFVPVYSYAQLAESVDGTDEQAQMRISKLSNVFAQIGKELAFVDSQLSLLDIEVLATAIELEPQYAHHLSEVIRRIPNQLHPEVERALAALSSTFQAPYDLYNMMKAVDIKFPDFTVAGEAYPISYVTFEGVWDSHPDTDKRRAAFAAFNDTLKDYAFTTGKAYDTQVQKEKTIASLRGFDSVIDYLLFEQNVDRDMYNRQIDVIMEELAPHMRKYAKLVQKVNGLDKMTFADLKAPIDASYEPQVTIEESKNYIFDALRVMGEDYLTLMKRSYDERWTDFAQNIGKATGAFCSTPYGIHPYILISWTGSMEDVFVLAHELGHAGHFYLTHENQNIFNSEPSLYFIEAPSTTNEMLMANHLLKSSQDPKFKRWVIASIVSRTYYHNFVTHLLEAAYQREVYAIIDEGGSVNASVLTKLKREVLEKFWGEAVEIDDEAALTWMRQPHYYMGLYPYTYSAGLTVATAVAQRIKNEGQVAVDDWLNVLKAGGTKSPKELAQMAGVDISTDAPLRETIAFIGSLIDELITLTEEIEG
ncbi:oligoendopeptidase F [Lysinibacillus sp. BF-4]|uniref:oligoendopeptidase F n=1 Tax=Lysinibacillus sp. BF-4 TaxID=1473546 RepID=UPI0005061E99|nr:oligoendopeptidase F [Lysinibacillus sp. BF-4]KFL43231.1 oligoendopeptidase F [Lysinibacillus sp. BF-4]